MLQHDKTLQGNELMLIHLRSDGKIHWADENFLRYMSIQDIDVIGVHKDVLYQSPQISIANIIIHTPIDIDRRVEAVDEQGDLFEVKITWKKSEAHIVIENIDRKKLIKKETVFGKFTLIEKIGRGGTAEVWKARDDDWGLVVAVKKMIAGTHASKENIKRFLKEAELMKRLNHNNICHIHEVGQHEGVYYISMEYIDGIDLNDFILSNTFLQLKQKFKIVKDVLSAVQHAHDNDIIHRDLKPANIMMRNNGEPVVMDFGLARIINTEHTITLDDQVVGTVDWMSPEQAQASNDVDERSDIFSVGAIMYYLITGQKWFNSSGNIFRDTKLIQKKELVPPRLLQPTLAKSIETIILKAMDKSPRRRYQSAINFLGDIVRFEKNQRITARKPTVLHRLHKKYKHNPVYFWALFCIASILILSSVLLYGQRLKELATWDLIFYEDFSSYDSPADVNQHWIGYSADSYTWSKGMIKSFTFTDSSFWHLDSGVFTSDLSKSNIFCANLTYKDRLPGNIRVEWKMKGFEHNLNYDAYIAGETRFDGYTFHLGGWDNEQYFVLTKGKDALILDYSIQDTPLETNREYEFVMEKEDKHIRLYMDGSLIFDYFDYNILSGERNQSFGFDNCLKHTQQVYDIKVYTQAIAQKISPISIGDAFFAKEQYQNAYDQYHQLMNAYSGSNIAKEAHFKKALCLAKLKRDSIAYTLFETFEQRHPSHEQVPYSIYERALIFQRKGEPQQEKLLYQELSVRFPGHPLLKPIFFNKGTALLNELHLLNTTNHDSIVSTILSKLDQVKIWAQLFDLDFENNPFSQPVFTQLLNLKEYDIILKHFNNPRYIHIYDKYAQLLYRMQTYDSIKSVDNYTKKLIALSHLRQRNYKALKKSISTYAGHDDVLATLFGMNAPPQLFTHFIDEPQFQPQYFSYYYTSGQSAHLKNLDSLSDIQTAYARTALTEFDEALALPEHPNGLKKWYHAMNTRVPFPITATTPLLHYSLSTAQDLKWATNPQFRNTLPSLDRHNKADSALNFDDSHFIDTPQYASLPNSITISAWINPSTVPTNRTSTILSLLLDNTESITLNLKNIKSHFHFEVVETKEVETTNFNSFCESTLSAWTHLTLVISEEDHHYTLYINGMFDSYIPRVQSLNSSSLSRVYIGTDAHSKIQFFNGSIDDVSIFGSALNPKEVQALFHSEQ